MIIQLLKKISLQELGEINNLVVQLAHDPKPLSLNAVSRILAQPELTCLVARDDAKKNMPIIGMASIIIYEIPTGKKGIIEDVVVDEKYRGQGLGQQLTQKLIDIAKQNYAKYVDLTSSPSRIAANELYKKMGFEKRETNVYRLKIS